MKADVASVRISFLLGLELMTEFQIVNSFMENTMKSKLDGPELPVSWKVVNASVKRKPNVVHSDKELRCLHYNFYRLRTDRLK